MMESVSVRVPATGANLGCLFDCGAIALSLYLDIRVTARAGGDVVVHYHGVNADRVSEGPDNLIARTMSATLRGWGVDPRIPIGN